jgi:magnesium transporter
LHPLLLEDILNTGQRPKLEEFDNCLFLVVKMLRYDKEKQMIISEQLSLVLGDTFLPTFQEQPGDVFEPVRERIRKQKGRIRGAGIDYLAYALLDCVVDNYIFIVERLGEQIEDFEEEVLEKAEPAVMEKINTLNGQRIMPPG